MSFFLIPAEMFSRLIARFSANVELDADREQSAELLAGAVRITDQDVKSMMQLRAGSGAIIDVLKAAKPYRNGDAPSKDAARQRALRARKKASNGEVAAVPQTVLSVATI